ncbi:MAG: hypothetical protein NVS4B2_25410 [Chloroflexota bacterium]
MIAPRDLLVQSALDHVHALMSLQRRAFCAQPLQRDISLPQLHILATLHEHGQMTLSELAHMLRISAPSASAIVDRMEERELARRTRDAFDRRVVHVQISEHGRLVVEEFAGMRREQLQRLFNAMTDQELRDFICGVAAVRSAADRLRDSREAAGTGTEPR